MRSAKCAQLLKKQDAKCRGIAPLFNKGCAANKKQEGLVLTEVIGGYSENPFQSMGNDIPLMSLCRTIEIDLREMLGETSLPPAIQAKKGVLM